MLHEALSALSLMILGRMELRLVRIATTGQLPNIKARQTKYVNSVYMLIWIYENNFSFLSGEKKKKFYGIDFKYCWD